MRNDEFKTLDHFLYLPNHGLEYFDPIWAQFLKLS